MGRPSLLHKWTSTKEGAYQSACRLECKPGSCGSASRFACGWSEGMCWSAWKRTRQGGTCGSSRRAAFGRAKSAAARLFPEGVTETCTA